MGSSPSTASSPHHIHVNASPPRSTGGGGGEEGSLSPIGPQATSEGITNHHTNTNTSSSNSGSQQQHAAARPNLTVDPNLLTPVAPQHVEGFLSPTAEDMLLLSPSAEDDASVELYQSLQQQQQQQQFVGGGGMSTTSPGLGWPKKIPFPASSSTSATSFQAHPQPPPHSQPSHLPMTMMMGSHSSTSNIVTPATASSSTVSPSAILIPHTASSHLSANNVPTIATMVTGGGGGIHSSYFLTTSASGMSWQHQSSNVSSQFNHLTTNPSSQQASFATIHTSTTTPGAHPVSTTVFTKAGGGSSTSLQNSHFPAGGIATSQPSGHGPHHPHNLQQCEDRLLFKGGGKTNGERNDDENDHIPMLQDAIFSDDDEGDTQRNRYPSSHHLPNYNHHQQQGGADVMKSVSTTAIFAHPKEPSPPQPAPPMHFVAAAPPTLRKTLSSGSWIYDQGKQVPTYTATVSATTSGGVTVDPLEDSLSRTPRVSDKTATAAVPMVRTSSLQLRTTSRTSSAHRLLENPSQHHHNSNHYYYEGASSAAAVAAESPSSPTRSSYARQTKVTGGESVLMTSLSLPTVELTALEL